MFSPVAARLAAGLPVDQVGTEVDIAELERLAVRQPEVDEDHVHGEVAQVDHVGNLTLTMQAADLEAAGMHLGDDVELRVAARPCARCSGSPTARTPSAPSPSR